MDGISTRQSRITVQGHACYPHQVYTPREADATLERLCHVEGWSYDLSSVCRRKVPVSEVLLDNLSRASG